METKFEIREPTANEAKFINYLLHGIAIWAIDHPMDRSVLVAGIGKLSQIAFCEQTSNDVKMQCREIDEFAMYLKSYAMQEAGNNEAM